MNFQIGPIELTPISLLSNDAWCNFTAVIIAILLWSFDKPISQKGKHFLLPLWIIATIGISIGSLCIFFNLILIGKIIIVVFIFGVVFFSLITIIFFIIVHMFGMTFLREGNIHSGIGPGNYFLK